MKVYGTIRQEVEINPIDVLSKINIVPEGDWVRDEDGKYIHYTEQSAGQHSFEMKVGEISKEKYDLYMAKIMLINYLSWDENKRKSL